MEKSWCELFVSHHEKCNSQFETCKSLFENYLKTIALNFAAIALDFTEMALNFAPMALNFVAMALNFAAMAQLMPFTRGRPLMISIIGGRIAPPPASSPTATTLSPPMSGEKAVIVRF